MALAAHTVDDSIHLPQAREWYRPATTIPAEASWFDCFLLVGTISSTLSATTTSTYFLGKAEREGGNISIREGIQVPGCIRGSFPIDGRDEWSRNSGSPTDLFTRSGRCCSRGMCACRRTSRGVLISQKYVDPEVVDDIKLILEKWTRLANLDTL